MPATLKDRVAELREEAQATVDQALAENRTTTPDEQAAIDSRLAAMKIIGDLASTSDEVVNQLANIAPPAQRDRRPASFGEAFVESDVMNQLRSQYPHGIPKDTRVPQTHAVRVGEVRNALLTDPHLTPPLHVIDAPTGVAVMDLMNAITIVDGAPDTIRHFTAAFTNAADIVAEGAVKPEATLTWTPLNLVQETIAHHIPVTNQALTHNAMLRQIIDAFLVNGVRARVQTEVATDLAAWVGLGTQAFDTDLRVTLRRAITKAQNAGAITGAGSPSILISSTDAETLDLEQLVNLVLSPGETPAQATNIWRTPLVVSANLPAGFAYVGDLRQIVFYTSGGVSVSTGWVANQFIENEQTILAETEGITGVLNASALIKTDLTNV